MKLVSSYFRDQPETPKERGVFWAEYVMRHKGAHHMRSAARQLNFFQYYCLDVFAIISALLGILFAILFYSIRRVCRKFKLVSSCESDGKIKKQ